MPRHLAVLSSLLLGSVLAPGIASAQPSFASHQVAQSPGGAYTFSAHGDFNNDGREDLIYTEPATSGSAAKTLLYLSSGDGTYDAPKSLSFIAQNGTTAVGDFNHDGKLDIAVFGTEVVVYLGNGDGSFQAGKTISGSTTVSQGQFLTAVDLNHDGKTDLVQGVDGTSADPNAFFMQVWISKGDGTFTAGEKITPSSNLVTQGVAGDFDGDGNADIALLFAVEGTTLVQVYYGDGTGKLGSPYMIGDSGPHTDGFADEPVSDINNDGRSDLVSTRFLYSPSGLSQQLAQIATYVGNSNRTMTLTFVSTSQCPQPYNGIAVADFNGDGINDLAFDEGPCTGTGSQNFSVKLGTGGGNFASDQTVYQHTYPVFGDTFAVRSTIGTKPDVIFFQDSATPDSNGITPTSLVLLSNSSIGGFPSCAADTAVGLNICSPGGTATSPVTFSIGAAGPTPMRGANVWVDGKKVAEQLTHSFSHYSFLDASVAVAPGSHSVAVYGTGIDETLQEKTFTLQVGSSGGACAAPASAGINICSPVNGSTPSSPVLASAAGTVTGTFLRFEVWIDGVKKFTSFTTDGADLSFPLAAGSHTFSFYAVNTAGTKWNKVSVVKVP